MQWENEAERVRKALALRLEVGEDDILHYESEAQRRGSSDIFVMIRKGGKEDIVNIIIGKSIHEFVDSVLKPTAAVV